MGLRRASERHPDVVVMAPALTETTQPHNFKLNPTEQGKLSLSLRGLNICKKYKRLAPSILKANDSDKLPYIKGMNGHSPPKTVFSINGLAKSIKNEFVPIDKSNVTQLAKDEMSTEETNGSSSDYTLTQIGGFMMNTACNSLDECEEGMGLNKVNHNVSDPDVTKEKISQGEVDQILKNFGVVLSDEIPTGSELGQNVDEILQVISNIEGEQGSEIPALETNTSDGESIFPMSGNDIAGSLTSLERELFNEVDMMNMCVDESLVNINKESVIKDRVEEARKKQFQIKRKCDFLMRRLRKLQARTVGKHVCDEVTGILEYTSNIFDAANKSKSHCDSSELKCDVKGVALSTLSLLMRQMEHSSTQQANYLARNSSKHKYFGSGSSSAALTSNGMRIPGTIIPSFKPEVKAEISRLSGELCTQLSMTQTEIDSDLTASSSGCESSDEVSFAHQPFHHQPNIPINKRALWRYLVERAQVVSRWTWLQARMADLEYKIRQTNEIKRQLRVSKGSVRLQPSPDHLYSNNGAVDEGSCCRTAGVALGQRRRKLVRCEGLHLRSKRAGRPTSLRCSCRPPACCMVCTGRKDAPALTPDLLPLPHRIARLDPAFHPQLSFSYEVSESLHYGALLGLSEWQTKAAQRVGGVFKSTGSGLASTSSGGRSVGTGQGSGNVTIGVGAARDAVQALDTDLKRPRLHDSSSQSALSSSSLFAGVRKRGGRGGRRKKFREGFRPIKSRKISIGSDGDVNKTKSLVESDSAVHNGGDSYKYVSPVPSPTPSKDQCRRKRENSYDIDNIVIPYSVAAATRPEKLQYKEILTPKWRLVTEYIEDTKNGIIRRPSHEADTEEDASEEAAILRHDRCEIEERKKFLSYLKVNRGGRGQRRTDSRAESSGPNTPDPMSPGGRENSLDSGDVLSRPVSPEPQMTRRRTVSGSSYQPKSPPPPPPISEVAPYPPRTFPLTDEIYKTMLQEQREFQEYSVEDTVAFKNCQVASR